MKIEKLYVGQVVKNYKELCALLEEKERTGKSKQLHLKDMERYFKYHKEGNKFVIDEIFDVAVEKEDKRKQGNHTGCYKYYEEFKETMLWLMRDWEIGTINHEYMKRIMTKTGLVSDKFLEINFTEESDIKEYQYRKRRIKDGVVKNSLDRMADEGLIDYKKVLVIVDCEGEERDTYDFEMDKYEEVRKEVIKEMGYKGFYDLDLHDKLNPKDGIMGKLNSKMLQRMSKLYGWNRIVSNCIRIVKNTDLKGSDMRKQLNDKVVKEYKESVSKKNKEVIDKIYEELCASVINAGREDKLMGRYEEPHKDILSDAMEDDRLDELQEIARKEEKMKAYESFKQEDVKPMENSWYEIDTELYAQAKRTEDKKEQSMTVFGMRTCVNNNDDDYDDEEIILL